MVLVVVTTKMRFMTVILDFFVEGRGVWVTWENGLTPGKGDFHLDGPNLALPRSVLDRADFRVIIGVEEGERDAVAVAVKDHSDKIQCAKYGDDNVADHLGRLCHALDIDVLAPQQGEESAQKQEGQDEIGKKGEECAHNKETVQGSHVFYR